MEKEEGRLVVMGRAEIDTRAPFKSVKEAVMLFGERVLAGEIYAPTLKEMQDRASENRQNESKMGALKAELEETRLSLQKGREEAEFMGKTMVSLRQELEQTKRELQWLKKQPIIDDPEIEDLKFIANSIDAEKKTQTAATDDDDEGGFRKKRDVKFAGPPSLTKLIVTKEEMLDKSPSAKKHINKKSLGPVSRWLLFSKKKATQQSQSPQTSRP